MNKKAAKSSRIYKITKPKVGSLTSPSMEYTPTASERKAIEQGRKDFLAGKCFTLKEVADQMGFDL